MVVKWCVDTIFEVKSGERMSVWKMFRDRSGMPAAPPCPAGLVLVEMVGMKFLGSAIMSPCTVTSVAHKKNIVFGANSS